MKTIRIKNVGGRTPEQLQYELYRGGRFVVYEWVISICIVSASIPSAIYYIPPGEDGGTQYLRGFFYSLLSIVFGAWAMPDGTIRTILAVRNNLRGGRDTTQEVAPLIGLDPGPPPTKSVAQRILAKEIGPRTDVQYMTRGELWSSAACFLGMGVGLIAVWFAVLWAFDGRNPDIFAYVWIVYVITMALVFGMLSLACGSYFLIRGLIRSSSYVPREPIAHVDVILVS